MLAEEAFFLEPLPFLSKSSQIMNQLFRLFRASLQRSSQLEWIVLFKDRHLVRQIDLEI